MMKHNLEQIMSGTFAILGVMCISSGFALSQSEVPKADVTSQVTKLTVTQKRVANIKNNEILLKDITLEINGSLSTNVKEYLKNPNSIETSIIKKLKLDTSNVNTAEAGKYKYTIKYKKKIYTGNVEVKDKIDAVETITLKELSLELGTTLSKDLSTYIKETLTDEVKNAIKLDLSKVDTSKAGNYLYYVNYNGKLYTSNITIYEPKYGTNSVVVENAQTTNVPVNGQTENEPVENNTQENTTPTENNNYYNTNTNQDNNTTPNDNNGKVVNETEEP